MKFTSDSTMALIVESKSVSVSNSLPTPFVSLSPSTTFSSLTSSTVTSSNNSLNDVNFVNCPNMCLDTLSLNDNSNKDYHNNDQDLLESNSGQEQTQLENPSTLAMNLPCQEVNVDSGQNLKRTNTQKKHVCHYDGCDASFTKKDRLRSHIYLWHAFLLQHKCTVEGCSKAFSSQTYLSRHLKRHQNWASVVAKQKVSLLSTSNNDSSSSNDNVNKNNSLISLSSLSPQPDSSLKSCISDSFRPPPAFKFKCNQCLEKFQRKNALRIHCNEAHQQPLPFTCATCSRSFCARYLLIRHEKRVHGPRRTHCCTQCEFSSDKWSEVREHIAFSHRKLECRYCGKRYSTRYNLHVHEEAVHGNKDIDLSETSSKTSVSIFRCPYEDCNKWYTRKGSLLTHLRRSVQHRNGVSPFQCNRCSRRFGYKQTLERHMAKMNCCQVSNCDDKDCKKDDDKHMSVNNKKSTNEVTNTATVVTENGESNQIIAHKSQPQPIELIEMKKKTKQINDTSIELDDKIETLSIDLNHEQKTTKKFISDEKKQHKITHSLLTLRKQIRNVVPFVSECDLEPEDRQLLAQLDQQDQPDSSLVVVSKPQQPSKRKRKKSIIKEKNSEQKDELDQSDCYSDNLSIAKKKLMTSKKKVKSVISLQFLAGLSESNLIE